MARIAGYDEDIFKNKDGEFKIDTSASEAFSESLLYKLSYYRYAHQQVGKISHGCPISLKYNAFKKILELF